MIVNYETPKVFREICIFYCSLPIFILFIISTIIEYDNIKMIFILLFLLYYFNIRMVFWVVKYEKYLKEKETDLLTIANNENMEKYKVILELNELLRKKYLVGFIVNNDKIVYKY